MWKILLAFCTHRVLLLVVALLAINSRTSPPRPGYTFKKLQPPAVLFHHFLEKPKEGIEYRELEAARAESPTKVFSVTSNPFVWIARWIGIIPVSSVALILILSNLFLIFFLWELNALLNRFALPEVASSAAVLAVLWITSYELSLGSSLSLSCYLMLLSLRQAVDNNWLVTGIALGALAFTEPLVLGLLPLLIYMFWYYQQHFSVGQIFQRAIFFLIPIGIVVALRWEMYQGVGGSFQASALNQLWLSMKSFDLGTLFSKAYVGQTLSLMLFLGGAIAALSTNTTLIHRLLPFYTLLVVVAFSNYANLASRLLLAAACLEGIAVVFSGFVTRLVQLALIILGAYEVASIFQ
jgi:hypothetical protein